jgi:beta-carotene 15,15'-dioxygenase
MNIGIYNRKILSLEPKLHQVFMIVVLAISLILHFFFGLTQVINEPLLAAVLILTLGVPHGSFDVLLIKQKLHGPNNTKYKLIRLIAIYVGMALTMLLFWWASSGLALVFFLLISAYHFGGDWVPDSLNTTDSNKDKSKYTNALVRFVVGSALLCSTTLLHSEEVKTIFSWLTKTENASVLSTYMKFIALPLLGIGIVTFSMFVFDSFLGFIELILVFSAAISLPPITFFVIYFCLLHSIRHLFEVQTKLSALNRNTIVKGALPYGLVAIISCLVGATFFNQLTVGPALLSAVFIGLAALTVPHMILVDHD